MAIYFHFGNGDQVQVASNTGWGDMRRAAETAKIDNESLIGLFRDGEAENIGELLEGFQGLHSPDQSTQKTIDGILEILVDHPEHDDAVVVTDGMEPDGDGQTQAE